MYVSVWVVLYLVPMLRFYVSCTALTFTEKHGNMKGGLLYDCILLHLGGTLLVAQLVEALRYKPEGRVFDSRWCH